MTCTLTSGGGFRTEAATPVNGTDVRLLSSKVLVCGTPTRSCGDSDCALKFMPMIVNSPVGTGAVCPGNATPYWHKPTSTGSGVKYTVPLPEPSVVTGNARLVLSV